MKKNFLFTSESVSEGHPDKIADQISDAILDAFIAVDPIARVACETLVKTGMVLIGGEVTSIAHIDLEAIVRKLIIEIGYNHSELGFDGNTCAFLNVLGKQSPDIALGVNQTADHEQGAGDQGLMFGYATNETECLMPAPITYAHKLMQRQAYLRKKAILPWLRPDAKTQISMHYVDYKPQYIETIVFSTQHEPSINHENLREAVIEEIIKPVIPKSWITSKTKFLVNPTGRFIIGGPLGDCGLTGRKIIVDSYGGMSRHGGGAFSGKDPSKVDRSAAYMARFIAKHIVAANLAARCEVQISYAIGRAEPTSLYIDTFGTGVISEEKLCKIILKHFNLKPKKIIECLDLLKPIYLPSATYGHFGRTEPSFTWEKLDKLDELKEYCT